MTTPSSNTFSGARGRVCDKSSLNRITYFQGVTQDQKKVRNTKDICN